jgi:hypothetical protein
MNLISRRLGNMQPPLWSSGQNSWLQIQIFREVVGLERGPPSHVKITEELLEWKCSGSGSGKRNTLYPQKLALTSPTCGDRSVGIVRLRTKATEFSLGVIWTGPIWFRIQTSEGLL